MREITCPSGLVVKLRDHTPPVVRLVQPNTLLEQYEQATRTREYDGEKEAWFRRLEKILKVIVADPPLYIADDIEDEIPPGHMATYELDDGDMGYIVGEWMKPIYERMQKLEAEAAPLSQSPTDASPSSSSPENTGSAPQS